MALDFEDRTAEESEEVSGHLLTILTAHGDAVEEWAPEVAEILPDHYVAPDRVAALLERLGKAAAANYVRDRLPVTKTGRSGDLGEIMSTEYIDAATDYSVPIKRLRWKDHRNMAMRGDDVIGIRSPAARRRVRFLKTETKSSAALDTATVASAREALDSHEGRPSPHAIAFVSERLNETGNVELADILLDAQYRDGITHRQVEHLLFTFSGNAPKAFLEADLEGYDGPIAQRSVGLRVALHQDFIRAVYELVENPDDA